MRSEITLSVLSRALDAHPSNKTSKTLRLRYLRAGEELWNASKLEEEWEDALKTDDVDLWIEWLDWRVRRVRSIENIVGDAQRVLFAFGRTNDEIGSLRVLWRVAVAFRDAGANVPIYNYISIDITALKDLLNAPPQCFKHKPSCKILKLLY